MDPTIQNIVRVGVFVLFVYIGRLIIPKFKEYRNRFKVFLKKVYRLCLSQQNQEQVVWNDLIALHKKENWNYSLHENTRCLESIIPVTDTTFNRFFYIISNNKFHCRVKVLPDFPEEITTEIFILASHINNILNDGIIRVDVEHNYVEYTKKEPVLTSLLVPNQVRNQIVLHYEAAIDIQWAFQELIEKGEEPIFVFSELLKKLEQKES